MKVLVIENYPQTPLGQVGRALAAAEADVRIISAHSGEPVPDRAGDFDGLVVLGGEQNALADESYPFLPMVCDLIGAFHHDTKPVLGICLGSQLIARSFGARNILDRPIEFGWRDVVPTDEGRADPVVSKLGDAAPLFHWHTDTFTLPEGAVHLASSDKTSHQAFRIGRATYAVQFHFEAGSAEVASWSRQFSESICAHTPDWPKRYGAEAARHAEAADRAGRAIADAWVRLLR